MGVFWLFAFEQSSYDLLSWQDKTTSGVTESFLCSQENSKNKRSQWWQVNMRDDPKQRQIIFKSVEPLFLTCCVFVEHGDPCDGPDVNYCMNGGTCYKITAMNTLSCV